MSSEITRSILIPKTILLAPLHLLGHRQVQQPIRTVYLVLPSGLQCHFPERRQHTLARVHITEQYQSFAQRRIGRSLHHPVVHAHPTVRFDNRLADIETTMNIRRHIYRLAVQKLPPITFRPDQRFPKVTFEPFLILRISEEVFGSIQDSASLEARLNP